MPLNDWWSERAEEKYWMVAPSRAGLGASLAAPQEVEGRRFEWSHELVSQVQPGDTVFVWDRLRPKPAIVAWASATGPLTVEDRDWAPPSARGRGAVPTPHWTMPVSDALPLAHPIDLAALRRLGQEIVGLRDELRSSTEGALYFPFIGGIRTLAPTPGYLTKFPRDLFALLSARYGFEFAL